jgi:hypothetical protein
MASQNQSPLVPGIGRLTYLSLSTFAQLGTRGFFV